MDKLKHLLCPGHQEYSSPIEISLRRAMDLGYLHTERGPSQCHQLKGRKLFGQVLGYQPMEVDLFPPNRLSLPGQSDDQSSVVQGKVAGMPKLSVMTDLHSILQIGG